MTLLTYLVPCPAARVPVTRSRCWRLLDIWHDLQRESSW